MTAEPILYPHTEGGWPPCRGCFRQDVTVTHAIDPRTGLLTLLCRECYRALDEGAALPLPTGQELLDTWERLARLQQNDEIDWFVVDAALTILAPHLSKEDGAAAFELLQEMLIRLQDLRSPMADPAAYEGGLEHAEHMTDDDRKYALKTLTGGTA